MVHATAAAAPESGRLRVGMIGGGRNAFIGAVHRMAMRLHDLIELKAGALSADVENARASGADLSLKTARACRRLAYAGPPSRRVCRGFANLYRGAAELISARRDPAARGDRREAPPCKAGA